MKLMKPSIPLARDQLTMGEVAARLGVGKRKVRELAHRTGHPIPFVKWGHRTYRISQVSFEQWQRNETAREAS